MFSIKISQNYPHEPPKVYQFNKVLCLNKIYHPNIDLDGNVCLNVLREDWKPVLSLHAVFVGLQYLFLEPNADDPLNKTAAMVLRADRQLFAKNVKIAMQGGCIDSITFDRVLFNQVDNKVIMTSSTLIYLVINIMVSLISSHHFYKTKHHITITTNLFRSRCRSLSQALCIISESSIYRAPNDASYGIISKYYFKVRLKDFNSKSLCD